MTEKVRCALRRCNKVLTEEMDIEYSAELDFYFCCPDHAVDYYFDQMQSRPLDVYFDDSKSTF